ncbi:hypothetical protein [Streptomyces sp. NPDC127098]|uniref:hypothetical protein n=1 Tax=Streptomyces sp. NPDC127098 TaxID=3347137 RepID=UPI003657E82F
MDKETGRARLELYVEALRARMPASQFILLMRAFNAWLTGGGGMMRLHLESDEQELFTPEVQGEMLTLMGLVGALSPGHEDRADHVVVELGDGEHVKGARSLVPREVADDPERLAEMRRRLDEGERLRREQRDSDSLEVDAIARASGMLPEGEA